MGERVFQLRREVALERAARGPCARETTYRPVRTPSSAANTSLPRWNEPSLVVRVALFGEPLRISSS